MLSADCAFFDVLGFDKSGDVAHPSGIEKLVEVANYYRVMRTLKTQTNPREKMRLADAYELLLQVEHPTASSPVEQVEALKRDLGRVYGNQPLSAASKFLWMRFRSPVIIYESLAARWLKKNSVYRDGSYSNYCQNWREQYEKHEDSIRNACGDLVNVKTFTLAADLPDREIVELTSNTWFRERVFDHYMLNNQEGGNR